MKPQEIEKAISTLHNYQKWRRGGTKTPQPDPKELGVEIDNVLRLLRALRYHSVVGKKEVLDKVNITIGACILDGYDVYDSCIKFMEELTKEINELLLIK